MTEVNQTEKSDPFITMSGRQLVQVGIIGLAVGLLTWGLSYLLGMYVFKAVFCPSAGAMRCVAATQYGEATAAILAAGVGLFALVRLQIFRPLLVVIACTVSLWGMIGMLVILPNFTVLAACIILYGLAYAAFAWLARIRVFLVAVIFTVILLVLVRLILTA